MLTHTTDNMFLYNVSICWKVIFMNNNILEKIKIFYNHNKNIITNTCFRVLLLLNLIAVPVILRKIINVMGINSKYIKSYSSIWYEQSKESRIFFEQQNIELTMACAIMASLLYSKHKTLAFLCLIIPLFYMVVQRFI